MALACGLGFTPVRDEEYDLLVPKAKLPSPPVVALLQALRTPGFRDDLESLGGFEACPDMGEIVLGA